MATDVTFTFGPSVEGKPTEYDVIWTVGGEPAATIHAPAAATFSRSFIADNPGVGLAPGDIIGASATAVDLPDSLSAAPAVASPVTIPVPIVTPSPAVNPTLTIVP